MSRERGGRGREGRDGMVVVRREVEGWHGVLHIIYIHSQLARRDETRWESNVLAIFGFVLRIIGPSGHFYI